MFAKSSYRPAIAIAVAAAGASIIALTGCGSGSGAQAASGSTSTAAASPAASAASGSTAGSAASSPADGTAAGSAPASHTAASRTLECNGGQLRVSYTDNAQIRNGALDGMSKTDNVVTFTNVGRSTCVIQGYPGVAALNGQGVQVAQAVRGGGAIHPVFLRPGATASSMVGANTASCASPVAVPGLLVTAPDQYTSVRLGAAGDMCLRSLTVNPVVPGDAAGLPL